MASKKRFIVAHRHGPRLDPKSERDLETFVSNTPEASIVRKTQVGRTVVELTKEQATDLATKNPHLIVEEDHELKLFAMPGLPPRIPTGEIRKLRVEVNDATNGKAIPQVTLYGIGAGIAYKAVTDADGKAVLEVREPSLVRVLAVPRDTYWSQMVPGSAVEGEAAIQFALKPLLSNGAYSWGHQLLGFPLISEYWTGKGIKVGVIDSGISKQVKELQPAGGTNTIDGADPDAWNVDEEGHGTHVAGLIGGRGQVTGGAPDAELYSIKVFPGGHLSDLVEAVEWSIRNGMDVINMSLGSPQPSQVLEGVLRDAYDRGITCVAAAGNDSAPVAYPAAFPTVIGVGAIGRFGTFPEDSAHTLKVSGSTDWRGGLFAASFTNTGNEVDVCAPGVAILSTVPTGLVAWDGTSMAAPLITALVALILEAHPHLHTGDAQQPEMVKSILLGASINLGMSPLIQGCGYPSAVRALAFAQQGAAQYARAAAYG